MNRLLNQICSFGRFVSFRTIAAVAVVLVCVSQFASAEVSSWSDALDSAGAVVHQDVVAVNVATDALFAPNAFDRLPISATHQVNCNTFLGASSTDAACLIEGIYTERL